MSTRIKVRSPYYIKDVSSSSGTSSISIYIYQGTLFTDRGTAKYSLSKPFVQDGSSYYAVYEVAELVRDYITTEFSGTHNNEPVWVEIDGLVAIESGTATSNNDGEGMSDADAGKQFLTTVSDGDFVLNETDDDFAFVQDVENDVSLFLETENGSSTTASFGNGDAYSIYSVPTFYLAYDGYSLFTEGINKTISNKSFLISGDTLYRPSDESITLPVNVDRIDIGDGWTYEFYANGVLQGSEQTGTAKGTDSANMISYITVSTSYDEVRVYRSPVGLGQRTLLGTAYIKDLNCTKHESVKVSFYNRFGAVQDLYFTGKTIESINVTGEEYKANNIDFSSLTYNVAKHQYNQYDKQGKRSVQLSTGYVNEDYNAWVEELMLSEKVWITLDSTLYPAKPKTSSQTFKTRLNDSLVAYTIDFDFAFDQIQNIR